MKAFRSEFHINRKSDIRTAIRNQKNRYIELDFFFLTDAIHKTVFLKTFPPLSPFCPLSHLTPAPTPRHYLKRKKKIENEYFEKTIFIYVDKNFEKFKNNRIIDFRLWKTIHHDFDIFDELMWKLFQKNQWKLIRNVCYFQKFWLNHSNIKETRQIIMHKTIKQNHFHKWTMN